MNMPPSVAVVSCIALFALSGCTGSGDRAPPPEPFGAAVHMISEAPARVDADVVLRLEVHGSGGAQVNVWGDSTSLVYADSRVFDFTMTEVLANLHVASDVPDITNITFTVSYENHVAKTSIEIAFYPESGVYEDRTMNGTLEQRCDHCMYAIGPTEAQGARGCIGFALGKSGFDCLWFPLASEDAGLYFQAASVPGNSIIELRTECSTADGTFIERMNSVEDESGTIPAEAGCIFIWDDQRAPTAITFRVATFPLWKQEPPR